MAPKETEVSGSHLFTVRLWVEDLGQASTEHRGTVRHVLSGAMWHFRDWEELRRSMVSAMEHYQRSLPPAECHLATAPRNELSMGREA